MLVVVSADEPPPAVIHAVDVVRERGLRCIALVGRHDGDLTRDTDVALQVPVAHRPSVREIHRLVGHLLTALVERQLGAADGMPALSPAARGIWEMACHGNARGRRLGLTSHAHRKKVG